MRGLLILATVFALQFFVSTVSARSNVPIERQVGIVAEVVPSQQFYNFTENCACSLNNCGCCTQVTAKRLHLDETVCANISYVSNDDALRVTTYVGEHVIYTTELPASHPPNACFNVPYFHNRGSICAGLYDVKTSDNDVTGCLEVRAKYLHMTVTTKKVGCFLIPLQNSSSSSGSNSDEKKN